MDQVAENTEWALCLWCNLLQASYSGRLPSLIWNSLPLTTMYGIAFVKGELSQTITTTLSLAGSTRNYTEKSVSILGRMVPVHLKTKQTTPISSARSTQNIPESDGKEAR